MRRERLTERAIVTAVHVGVHYSANLDKHTDNGQWKHHTNVFGKWNCTYLYKAAETVLALTVFELRLHQATCIACANDWLDVYTKLSRCFKPYLTERIIILSV